MLDTIGSGVSFIIANVGKVVSALFTENGHFAALLPIVGVAVGIGIVGFGIRTIKNVVWGY